MSLLVDGADWAWRGERWAHLTSDSSFDELHQFANRLGVRRLAFQDDHYDLPSALRELALAHGAVPVTSRALVAALRSAGLRVRGRRTPWSSGDPRDPAVRVALVPVLDAWPRLRDVSWSTVLHRPGEVALSTALAPRGAPAADVVPPPLTRVAFIVERPEGRILDVVLRLAPE